MWRIHENYIWHVIKWWCKTHLITVILFSFWNFLSEAVFYITLHRKITLIFVTKYWSKLLCNVSWATKWQIDINECSIINQPSLWFPKIRSQFATTDWLRIDRQCCKINRYSLHLPVMSASFYQWHLTVFYEI